jgi:zinc transport system permease protein
VAFTVTGLWLSYFLNLTSGATIILVSGAAYLVSLLVKPLIRRPRQRGPGARVRDRTTVKE